ncbi:MAG: response regulator [Desulfobacterales bacterium]|nr:response regulator [Desulfobacterales bacterium]
MIKVLTIDDEDIFRENISAFLEDNDYHVIQSDNGEDGLERFKKTAPDIVLCDLKMPKMDGFQVLEAIVRQAPETPIIMISGTGAIHDVIESLRLGAWDYILKPIYDMGALEHALGKALERSRLIRENRRHREHLEEEVKKRTQEIQERTNELQMANRQLNSEINERKAAESQLKNSLNSLEKTIAGTISTISLIVEMRDPYTGGHQRHVAQLSQAIAQEMGFSDEQLKGIYYAGLIHDIGKLAVPIEILVKPGPISEIENMMIRTHPQAGWEILKEIEFPWPIAEIALQHHERLDGSGYPHGLSGDDILPESRIVAVADVVESMMFHRPYRASLGLEVAMEEISANRGQLYDAGVVDTCIRLFREKDFHFDSEEQTLDEIFSSFSDR